MATITTRNVDPAIVTALKARARSNGRSMEAEVREILADAVRDRHGALARIETIKRERVQSVSAEDVDAWIQGAWGTSS